MNKNDTLKRPAFWVGGSVLLSCFHLWIITVRFQQYSTGFSEYIQSTATIHSKGLTKVFYTCVLTVHSMNHSSAASLCYSPYLDQHSFAAFLSLWGELVLLPETHIELLSCSALDAHHEHCSAPYPGLYSPGACDIFLATWTLPAGQALLRHTLICPCRSASLHCTR